MGQQRAPLHRHTSGYDYYLSLLSRQVYFQPPSSLRISAAVSTWQQSWPCYPFIQQSGPDIAWVSRGLGLPTG